MDISRRPPDVAPAATGVPGTDIPGAAPGMSELPQLSLETLAGPQETRTDMLTGNGGQNDITAPPERRQPHAAGEVARHAGATVLEKTAKTDTPPSEASEGVVAAAAAITARAARFGITLPPEMAKRAGEIMTGERVVDPEAAAGRDNSRSVQADRTTTAEPNEGAGAEHADAATDNTPPTVGETLSSRWSESGRSLTDISRESGVPLRTIIDFFNGNSQPGISDVIIPLMQGIGVPPSEGLAIIDRYRAEIDPSQLPSPEAPATEQPVITDLPVMEPLEQTTDTQTTAPTDTSEGNTAAGPLPDAPAKRWAAGQLREAVQALSDGYKAAGEDLATQLTPRQQEALQHLLDPEVTSMAEVAERLGLPSSQASILARRLLERGSARAEERGIPTSLPEPTATTHERTTELVGGTLSELQKQSGITLEEIAEQSGVSVSTLTRFFNSDTHPPAGRVLDRVIDAMGIPEDQAATLRDQYQNERADALYAAALVREDRQEQAGQAPPHDRSINRPRWAAGQTREVLRALDRSLNDQGGVAPLFSAKAHGQAQVADLLVNTDFTHAQIAERLGITVGEVARLASHATKTVLDRVPEDARPADLPQPAAKASEIQPDTVGGKVDLLIKERGIGLGALAKEIGLDTPQTLRRFLTGATHPNRQFLQGVLNALGVPEEEATPIIEQYRQDLARLREQRRNGR